VTSPHAAADRTIREVIRRSDRAILSTADARRTLRMMEAADAELARRLVRVLGRSGGDITYSAAKIMSTREQIAVVVERTRRQLGRQVYEASRTLSTAGVLDAVETITRLERQFSGIADITLDIDRARTLQSIATENLGSLLARHEVSVGNYGIHMIGRFELALSQGLLQGDTQAEMVTRLTGHGGGRGVQGVFRKQDYWARRIVRTESSYAYNQANWKANRRASAQFGDMGKKILAIFDRRTAADSVYVHGQIRQVDEPFIDGAGRVYQHPPGRPNDRETVIPWRMAWPETATSRPRPPEEVGRVEVAAIPDYRKPARGLARREAIDDVAQQIRQEKAHAANMRRAARDMYGR